MKKIDYKKDYKELYLPKDVPSIITVPSMNFMMIEGQGDPNREVFALKTAALYSLSYAVKMSYRSGRVPEGYYEYTVFPLEGVWDLVDKTKPHTDKNNLAYRIMIRQPDFLTPELFDRFLTETKKKKPNPFLNEVQLGTVNEGLCCQMLHLGSYDTESESFSRMEQFCKENGYRRSLLTHREIYLTDPRRSEAEKLKTVLRFQVEAEA